MKYNSLKGIISRGLCDKNNKTKTISKENIKILCNRRSVLLINVKNRIK